MSLSGITRNVRDVLEETQKVSRRAVETMKKLLKVTNRLENDKSDSVKALIRKTFDSHVNRPLVGNAPVRKIIFKDPNESLMVLSTIARDFDSSFCKLMLKGNTLGRIQRMMSAISGSSANIVIRSLILLNLYFDDQLFGQYSLTDMIIKNIQQLSLAPDEVVTYRYAEAFVNRLAKPIYDVLKVLMLNRNRQRAYIDAVMLRDWSSLFEEAHLVDATYKKENPETPLYFSLYVLIHTIQLMDHFVALGIELDLFCGEHETAVAFWYRDFLLSSLLSQLSTMRQVKKLNKQAKVQAAESKNTSRQQRGKKKGRKTGSSKGGTQIQAPTAEDMEDEFDFLLLNLKRGVCRGIVRVSV